MSDSHLIGAKDQALVATLRARRELLGYTQTEVAERLKEQGFNLGQSGLSRVEKGDRVLTVGEALAYARALDATLNELLEPEPEDELIAEGRNLLRLLNASQRDAAMVLSKLMDLCAILEQDIQLHREALLQADPRSHSYSKLRKALNKLEFAATFYHDPEVHHLLLNTAGRLGAFDSEFDEAPTSVKS